MYFKSILSKIKIFFTPMTFAKSIRIQGAQNIAHRPWRPTDEARSCRRSSGYGSGRRYR